MRKPLQAAALSALLFSFNGETQAQTLPLDPTFGTAGIANLGAIPAFYPIDMDLQTDGKILCLYSSSGNTYAMRVKSDGNLDNTFQADLGYQLWPTPVSGAQQFTGKSCNPNSALIREMNDTKVIIVFSGYGIMRVKPNGSVDSTFGNLSYAPGYLDFNYPTPPLHEFINVHDLYDASASGHYYVGPASIGIGMTDTVLIAKTNPSGAYDASYGTGGQKYILLDSAKFGYINAIRKIMFTSSGKILFTGQSRRASSPGTQGDVFVARYNNDGTPDMTFGTGGVKIVDFNNMNQDPWAITCAANGDIYVSGVQDTIPTSVTRQYFTFKMSPTGVVDMTYGGSGVIVDAPPASVTAYAMSLTTTSYNKLYMAGFYSPSFMVYKNEYHSYTATGAPNTVFSPGGVVNNNIYERAQKLMTQPADNKILILGGDAAIPKLMRISGDQMPVQPNGIMNTTASDEKAWISGNVAYISTTDRNATVEAALLSIDGRRIRHYRTSDFTSNGSNTSTVHLPTDLPQGLYILSVHRDGETQQVKFVR